MDILAKRSLKRNESLIGKTEDVLFEGPAKKGEGMFVGRTAGNRVVIAGVTCFEDGRGSDERRVQVSMQRNSDVTTAVFTSDGVLSAQSVARFERA